MFDSLGVGWLRADEQFWPTVIWAQLIRKHVFFFSNRVLGGNGSNDHAKLKSENGFVELNRKLVQRFGPRFSVRSSEQAKQKNDFSESGPKNLNSLFLEGQVHISD